MKPGSLAAALVLGLLIGALGARFVLGTESTPIDSAVHEELLAIHQQIDTLIESIDGLRARSSPTETASSVIRQPSMDALSASIDHMKGDIELIKRCIGAVDDPLKIDSSPRPKSIERIDGLLDSLSSDPGNTARKYCFWTNQMVYQLFGAPDGSGYSGGETEWSYASGSGQVIAFTFLDGYVTHVKKRTQ